MNNKVSVIIPTYGGGDKLSRAIESVINQSYSEIEIIIVDDNPPYSEERILTSNVVSKYNYDFIKYIKHSKNKNGAAARNTGLKFAEGSFICFLDDDDFLFPDRIKKSVEILNKNQEYGALYCSVILADKNGIYNVVRADKIISSKDILLDEGIIGTGSNIFIRRNIIKYLEGFDESFSRHQDLEFLLRVCKYTNILNLNDVLIVKSTNQTNNIPNYNKFKEVKNKYFEKFKTEIDKLNSQEYIFFYEYHYLKLLNVALKTNNKDYIKEALTDLSKIRKVKTIEKIKVFLMQNSIYCNIFFSIKKYLSKIKRLKLKSNYINKKILTEELISFAEKTL